MYENQTAHTKEKDMTWKALCRAIDSAINGKNLSRHEAFHYIKQNLYPDYKKRMQIKERKGI